MIREAIDRIIQLAESKIIVGEDGLERKSTNLKLILPPLEVPLMTATLTGFADVIGAMALTRCLLMVSSPTMVTCCDIDADKYGQRQEHVHAVHDHKPFGFGTFMSHEEFVIGLRSKFVVTTDDLEYVCKMASNVGNGVVAVSQDDGISQELSVKRGIAIKGTETLRGIVNLTPWRTVTEAVQPTSKFLFRARSQGDNLPPQLALIEADGGAWKVEAAKNIADWLKGNSATGPLTVVR